MADAKIQIYVTVWRKPSSLWSNSLIAWSRTPL